MCSFFKKLFSSSTKNDKQKARILNSVIEVTKILEKKGYSDIDFSKSGYQVFVFDDVKTYVYPERDNIRFTCIPIGRRYNLDTKLILKNSKFGELIVLPQKHKSNPEIMLNIPIKALTLERFNECEDFFIRFTHRLFLNFNHILKLAVLNEVRIIVDTNDLLISSGDVQSMLDGTGIILL